MQSLAYRFWFELCVTCPTVLYYGDSLIPSMQLGSHSYTNVYVQSIDTLQPPFTNRKIWKTYYSLTAGLLGFHDRQTHTLFYRQ